MAVNMIQQRQAPEKCLKFVIERVGGNKFFKRQFIMDKILKAADDILHVFYETSEWLGRDKSLVVKILTELVEEKFKSTNSDYMKCSCPCPSLPVGFTVLEPKNVLCKKCGELII